MKMQRGLVLTEMAVISAALMLILFGAIEISRMLFTWNTLDAVTQRAARIAAVCPPDHSAIAEIAMFGTPGGDSAVLPGFTAANLQFDYLDNVMATTVEIDEIIFVRASIVNYQHTLAIPFVSDRIINSPTFSTVIPSESLGFIPFAGGGRSCFGST